MPRKSFTPRVDSIKVQRRNLNSFAPLMNDIECFSCHEFGNITSFCRRKLDTSMQQFGKKGMRSSFVYTSLFNGLCYVCNLFGHKAIDCRSSTRSQKSSTRNKRLDPLASYLGHVECYMCHSFGHMTKYFYMPRSMRPSVQKQQPKKHAQQRNQ